MKTANPIRDELVAFTLPDGGRGLAALPVIPADAPYAVREGIARRRLVATAGRCPCGATLDLEAARRGQLKVAEVAHEHGCPAITNRLVKAIRRWLR